LLVPCAFLLRIVIEVRLIKLTKNWCRNIKNLNHNIVPQINDSETNSTNNKEDKDNKENNQNQIIELSI